MIGRDLLNVQHRWPKTRKPLVDSFGAGLFEVRSTAGRTEYRLLFCEHRRDLVVLHGFEKKTRATPAEAIRLARSRQAEVTRGDR